MVSLLKDTDFDAQFKRTLGHAVHSGAEIGECLHATSKIKSGDYTGWHNAWRALADGLVQNAEEEKQQKSHVSAGEKLLRASNYYRTAYFFLEENPSDPRIQECLELSKKHFKKGLDQLDVRYTALKIPYGDTFLPGYLYLSLNPAAKLLFDTGGGDSTIEELYFTSAVPALKRGYHCLTIEGPGQGSVLRLQKIPFRPDWEVVTKAAIDHLQALDASLIEHLILRGDSFGGYLAARSAAFEKRIKACVLNPAILNPMEPLKKLQSEWLRSIVFFFKPSVRFKIVSRYPRFGASTFEEMLQYGKDYNLDQLASKITCPALVIDNDEESLSQGEAQKLYDQLQCPKKYHLFTKDQCTGGHCQPLKELSTQELIFDWLDTLKI